MLTQLNYTISKELLQEAIKDIPNFEDRITINKPKGDFFYDEWEVDSKFQNSVWTKLLETLPVQIGEARLIKLMPGICYRSHADIDDRYHLSLVGDKSYLVDLDGNTMYPTTSDLKWYEMDASKRHSAVNFGGQPRIQLVIRKLLKRNNLRTPIDVTIKLVKNVNNFRYIFDDLFSPILNKYNKEGIITDFKFTESVNFKIEKKFLDTIKNICPAEFEIV